MATPLPDKIEVKCTKNIISKKKRKHWPRTGAYVTKKYYWHMLLTETTARPKISNKLP